MKGSNYVNDPKTQYYSVIYIDDKRTDPWYTALEVEQHVATPSLSVHCFNAKLLANLTCNHLYSRYAHS